MLDWPAEVWIYLIKPSADVVYVWCVVQVAWELGVLAEVWIYLIKPPSEFNSVYSSAEGLIWYIVSSAGLYNCFPAKIPNNRLL